jgi:hypothetical protein
MECSLYKYNKETATHYIGCTGNEYPKDEYCNHGKGGIYRGFKDLPEDEYPYTIKYKVELLFECCKLCSCDGKEKLKI